MPENVRMLITILGTARAVDCQVQDRIEASLRAMTAGVALAHCS